MWVEYEVSKIPYQIDGEYTPDFTITTKSGKTLYIEAKGNGRYFDQRVRQKMIAVKKGHPELDIRIVFYADGKIGPVRKDGTFRRQSDWAKKNDYVFAIRDVPEEWLNE